MKGISNYLEWKELSIAPLILTLRLKVSIPASTLTVSGYDRVSSLRFILITTGMRIRTLQVYKPLCSFAIGRSAADFL